MTTRWAWHMLIAADNNLFKTVAGQMAQLADTNPRHVMVAAQLDTPGKRARRHALRADGSFRRLGRSKGTSRNLNAGSKQSLINFLIASRRLRRAPATVVVFSTHGIGISDLTKFGSARPQSADQIFVRKGAFALGVDDTSRDYLDNNELQEGLEYAYRGHPIPQIIGCDACLLGMVEVAHQLRRCGHYLVASQHVTPANGWPYRRILKTFSDRTTPLRAVQNIVGAYREMSVRANDDDATLSAVKLALMDELASSLDRLGGALVHCLQGGLPKLARAREAARAFANFDSIDLKGYAEAVKTQFKTDKTKNGQGRSVRAAANEVLAVLDRAIVATSNDPKSGANGLSVYLPNSRVIDAYHDLPLSKEAPHWHDFVVAYGAMRHLI